MSPGISPEKVVTSNGAPSMVGATSGFVQFFVKETKRQVIQFLCITHQEGLCTKESSKNFENVLRDNTKMANQIMTRALNCRQFQLRRFRHSINVYFVQQRPVTEQRTSPGEIRDLLRNLENFTSADNLTSHQEIYEELSSFVAAAKVNFSKRFLQFVIIETTCVFLLFEVRRNLKNLISPLRTLVWKNACYDQCETLLKIEGMINCSKPNCEN